MIPGMAHDIPPALWNRVLEEIVLRARGAREAMTERAGLDQLEEEEY
jgi:hypothetical protein